jgi:hypothetical protein
MRLHKLDMCAILEHEPGCAGLVLADAYERATSLAARIPHAIGVSHEQPGAIPHFREVRGKDGKLYGEIDLVNLILYIKRGRVSETIDLRQL